jgi:selenocysteine lyase/cysteine desulfurase
VFDGYAPDEIGRVLDERFDIAVRTGLHCAPGAHKFLGTAPAGTVRFSLGYFNEPSDIAQLGEALDYIAKNG